MMAVMKTGGKQYVVREGDTLAVEKIDGAPETTVSFDEVLLVATGKDGAAVTVGAPLVDGARVEATVVEQTRAAKVTGVKYKPKKRTRLRFGHRQPQTLVRITKIHTA